MNRAHGVERVYRLIIIRVKRVRREASKSRNIRVTSKAMREKYGIKKWYDTMQKELIALEKLNVWKFYLSYYKMPSEY